MNGHTPNGAAIPASVQQARRASPSGPRPWTGLWRGRILGIVVVLALVALVVAKIVSQRQSTPKKATPTESTLEPMWGRQTFQYKAEEPAAPQTPAPPVDTTGPELARLRAELGGVKQEIEGLKSRRDPVATEKKTTTAVPVRRATPAPLVFVTHDLGKEAQPPVSKVPEYVLAPWATRLPCSIEPLMNSDVPGTFSAKVNQNVYDTKTHRHLLVPQGATVGGVDRGESIVYGNERLPTVALALTIDDRTYDLGNAPVTDQLGTNGLVNDVDQHYGRLLAAVLIQGVLKAGTMAITESAGGTVVSGVTSTSNQATNKVTAPMLNTRPTIRVFPGQGCTVLLTKPLTLPAVWE